MASLTDMYGKGAPSAPDNVEIDPKGGYWLNTTKGRQHFPGAPPAPTQPLPIPQPVSDFLSKASNVLETPLSALGAAQMDFMREPRWQIGMGPSGKNFVNLLKQRKLGEAATDYSTTSLQANRQRAKLGDPGAQFLDKHPGMLFAPLAFAEEFFNPSNKAFSALGGVGRAAGLKPLDPLNRFADVRSAAREAATQRAAAAQATANRAARATATRQGAAQGRAEAKAAAHFAEKQRQSAEAQRVREHFNQQRAGQPGAVAGTPTRPALGEGVHPQGEPVAPQRPVPPASQSLAGDRSALAPGRGILPGANVPPAPLPLVGEQRLGLPPGGTTELPLQNKLRGLLKQMKKRPPKPAPPIIAGPLTPPRVVGGRPALPPAPVTGGASRAAGEGFAMSEPPHPTGQAALTGANPVPEFEGLIPPNRLPPGEPRTAIPRDTREAMTTPGSKLANMYGEGKAVTPVGEVHPIGPTPQLDPEEAGKQAEVEFRKMTDTQTPKAFASKATHDLYAGLPLAEQQRLFDAIEAGKIPTEYAARYQRYTQAQRQVSRWLLEHGLADESQLWNEATFHPRSGSLLNPDYDVEEQPETTVGSRGIRKGTLKNRRTFRTRQDAITAGEQANPEWSPAETLEKTLNQRMTAIQLEHGMGRLKELGLIVGPESPRPPGWVRLSDEPDVARFGSPTISGGASFHPSIAKGIRDITAGAMNPEKLLSSPLHKAMTPFTMANRAAMRFQVGQPFYHLPVNVIPNQISTLLAHSKSIASLPEYVKQWFTGGKATGELYEKGVYFPYASDIPAHKMTRPWSDLSVKEKAERLWNLAGRGVENVSSKPLYGWAEPRAAKAMFRALKKGGKSDAEAALLTRQTTGEQENIGAAERDLSQMMKFPAWRKSVFRLWPSLLGRSPALYNAPHRAARAFNESRGLAPQPGDSDVLLPGLAWGKDAQGNPQTLNVPSPANIPLELMNILGSPLAGDTDQDMQRSLRLGLTLVNPLLNTGVRTAMTEAGSSGEPNTGLGGYRIYDKDARENQTFLGKVGSALEQTGERNAPIRNEGTGPLAAIGLGLKPVPNDDARLTAAVMESRYRRLIARLHYAAQDAKKAGDADGAAEDIKQANELHDEMEQNIKDLQAPQPASSGAASGSSLESMYGSKSP